LRKKVVTTLNGSYPSSSAVDLKFALAKYLTGKIKIRSKRLRQRTCCACSSWSGNEYFVPLQIGIAPLRLKSDSNTTFLEKK